MTRPRPAACETELTPADHAALSAPPRAALPTFVRPALSAPSRAALPTFVRPALPQWPGGLVDLRGRTW